MKIKLAYVYAIYEVASFFYEMKKRKASSIRFEFQESIGKFTIYIDNSSFKTIDSRIAWEIIKNIYTFIAKKTKTKFDKEKSFEGELTEEEIESINKKFQYTLIPLPKGKCLNYSYHKRAGSIYEAAFSFKDNDIKSIINENIDEIKELLNEGKNIIFNYSKTDPSLVYDVEDIMIKNSKKDSKNDLLLLFLVDDNDKDVTINVNLEKFKTKKDVSLFFSKFKNNKKNKKEDNLWVE